MNDLHSTVGRDEEHAWVMGHVADPSWPGCVFVGPPGIGTTCLARSLAGALTAVDRKTIWLRAVNGRPGPPLDLVRPLIDEASAGEESHTELRHVADLVAGTSGTVMVIDDAHNLDEVTSAFLIHLLDERQVQIVATSKLKHLGGPGPLTSILRRGLETWQLRPLSEAASEELFLSVCERDDADLPLDHYKAGGRPALIAAQAHDRPLPQLSGLVDAWLGEMADAAVNAARFLAVVGPLPVQLAAKIAGSAALADLERAGLAKGSSSGRRLSIQLDPPIVKDIIWNRLGPVERQLTSSMLSQTINSLPSRRAEDACLIVKLATRGGAMPSEDVLSRAARHAVESGDIDLAESLVALVQPADSADLADSEVVGYEATNRSSVGRPSLDDTTLAELRLIQVSEDALTQGSPDAFVRHVRHVLDREESSERERVLAESMLCDVEADRKTVGALAEEVSSVIVRAEPIGLPSQALRALDHYNAAVGGCPSRASAPTDVTVGVERWPQARRLLVRLRMELARFVNAELAAPIGAIVSEPGTNSWRIGDLLDGLRAATGGDLGRAKQRLADARRTDDDLDPAWLRGTTSALSALLAAELGLAPSLAGRQAGGRSEYGWLRPSGIWAVADAWTLYRSSPDPAFAADSMRSKIGRLVDQTGERAWAALALIVACRFDNVAGLEDLIREVCLTTEGPVAAQMALLGPALVADDVGVVQDSAYAFARQGLGPLAAECFEAAAIRTEATGATILSRQLYFRRDVVLRNAQSPVLGNRSRILSVREREIVDLLDDTKSNRDIAAELFLSKRTVENHLSRIYRRVGVSSRGQLLELSDQAKWP